MVSHIHNHFLDVHYLCDLLVNIRDIILGVIRDKFLDVIRDRFLDVIRDRFLDVIRDRFLDVMGKTFLYVMYEDIVYVLQEIILDGILNELLQSMQENECLSRNTNLLAFCFTFKAA